MMTKAARLSFEGAILRMTPEQIVLAHKDRHFSESCRLTVRDTEREEVRDRITNALWRSLFGPA